ncbi:centrosomal protein of 152 kDa isoform X2 [Sceloporus undulatus]|uniref:centrosomal protein of 152 kDa isoform X2 n=1 Tax=Sceloporus undulatus TaxID=8520 RepID=UPI001C4A93AC|nr:centrosomal protein of 152 kDa isoform X2 [Sceloporus undulatus]
MSLDFDSAALQMQHEDEEYDQEDYVREQELQQLLTDLPHDMLEDSGDHLSDYSAPEDHERVNEHWDQNANQWDDHPVATNTQSDYEQGPNVYGDNFLYDQGNIQGEIHARDWSDHRNKNEDKNMYEISGRISEDGSDDVYLREDGYKASSHYQQTNAYHFPENVRLYTNGQQQEFSNQHSKIANLVDAKKEHLKFGTSEGTTKQPMEPYKVIYKPYENNIQQPGSVSPDAPRRNEVFEEMQQEFLGTGENSSENMQILQLQIINKAKERKLEELNKQLEDRAQQIRYLSHQLAIVKDEKDGMCLSLQESQKNFQNGKEIEIQLEGQIKALKTQIQTLTANEEQLIKKAKIAEVAMESMQQQLLELRRSDALQRAREQHEAIVAALKQKYEEQVMSLQQKLDASHVALQEQTELCCHLKEHVKQLERTLEESKLEKNEMISRLSRSLEESQNQCANLLQTGWVKETNELRMQLQQAQSAHLISTEMNKALQEELKEQKEEILLYESAAKHGVFLSNPHEGLNEMSDSYVDLGIKKINKKTRLHSPTEHKEADRGLSKDEIILELKDEMERLLRSNKSKRNRVSQLQNELEDCQRTIDELKQQLVKTNVHEHKGKNIQRPSDTLQSDNTEEILRLEKENEILLQEIESHNARVQELIESQEKLKNANQELCSQMRQMVQDSDRDKQEALDRCEKIYQQHYEDVKKKLCEEFTERHMEEKEKLIQAYEDNISQLKTDTDELSKEVIAVKECYIAVCRERDELEATLKAAFEQEQQVWEDKLKKQLLDEMEESLSKLKTELEDAHHNAMELAKSQWQKEKTEMKKHAENEVAKAKAFSEKKMKEIKEQAVREIEKEWQNKLDQALEGAKTSVMELKDNGNQTEPLSIRDDTIRQLITEVVEEQTLLFQEALKEKEKALREYEARHHESIANQVSLALSAAEEKWKKEIENSDKVRVRSKDLEEKIHSLKRELDLKKDEIPAIIKAELAKARTQWNKEKQEEVLRIQNQNEKDYHSFLQDHKNKINEVLAKAKEDFAKQKKELLDQKETELKIQLGQKQQEWAVQEAKRFQNEIRQYEDRILVQIELLLDDMHKDLVKFTGDEHAWQAKWTAPAHINLHFKEKLIFCLQKAYKATICTILEKNKQTWNEKHEDLNYNFKYVEDSSIQNEGENGDKARPFIYDVGQQVELQRMLRNQPSLQETDVDTDSACKKRNLLSREGICWDHCQQLERKEKECQDLKKKLDKACRHLQLAVKEQNSKLEQEKTLKALIEENSVLKNQLDDLKSAHAPPRSLSEGCVSKPCNSCDGKALEDMRSQYIKAVGKIKRDMLRYIHESKERAAEIIKAEVFRERQETARKMRKYYLICLQQLLNDDRKHEGAEKKIICAAGKIATMAKILETPVRNSPQNKTTHLVLSQNSKLLFEDEEPKRNYIQQSRPTPMEHQTHGESMGNKTSNPLTQRRIPCSLQHQFENESQSIPVSQTWVDGKAFKQLEDPSVIAEGESRSHDLPHVATFQNPPPCISKAKFQGIKLTSSTDGASDSGATYERLNNLNERSVIKELSCPQSANHWKATSEKTHIFEVQETPVKDDGCSSDWSLVSETLQMDSKDASLYPIQKSHSKTPLESCRQFSMANLFSHAKEDTSLFCEQSVGHKDKSLVAKGPNTNYKEGHQTVNPDEMPYSNLEDLSSDPQASGTVLCSTEGKNYNPLHSRKQMRDVTAFQQDSGFASSQINFD